MTQTPTQPQHEASPPPTTRASGARQVLLSLAVLLVATLVIGGVYRGSHGGPGSPSPASGTWTTTHSYSGNGIQQTEVFTVSSDWMLQWTCDPSSFAGNPYNVIVMIDNADGSLAGGAVNTICSATNASGSTELHQGGQVYLSINSEAVWSLTIQELQ